MKPTHVHSLVRAVAVSGSRRALLGALAASTAPLSAIAAAAGKRKGKQARRGKRRCRNDGRQCKKKSASCKAQFCLKTPFTIEARWSNPDTDHDTVLFVPNEAGSLDPSPFIDQRCRPSSSDCETDVYPFTCVSQDAQGPGDEIATIRRMRPGTYSYWVELFSSAPAADLTVLLRSANGTVLRSWTSPANPSATVQRGWHVFDIDGAKQSFTSVDELHDDHPLNERAPVTSVCP